MAVTVIPLNHPAVEPRANARDKVAFLRAQAETLSSPDLLKLAFGVFPGRIAVISAFAAESVVLLHQVAQIDPSTPVLFLNTHKLFGETMRYRDRIQETLGLTDIRSVGPHPDDRRAQDPEGTLWSRNPDACCHFRKVVPLRRALAGFDAVVTGRKRFQTSERAGLEKVELAEGRVRFNPLVDWSLTELMAYMDEHRLPKHPLINDGYPSIGCIPCTRRVNAGEGYRDGRWAGWEKDECGIHAGLDGEGI
jgi:phosphoadenosine phosphosulfate reductase